MKVTRVPGTYTLDGKNYGPFEASAQQPFLEVPEGLALALGLPEFAGEVQAPPVSGDDEAAVQLEEARADLGRVTAERDDLKRQLDEVRAALQNAKRAIDDKTRERDEAWTYARSLEASGTRLPADAKDRLVKLDKIGPATADAIIAALTALPEGEAS